LERSFGILGEEAYELELPAIAFATFGATDVNSAFISADVKHAFTRRLTLRTVGVKQMSILRMDKNCHSGLP
jgi:hypothetical protein